MIVVCIPTLHIIIESHIQLNLSEPTHQKTKRPDLLKSRYPIIIRINFFFWLLYPGPEKFGISDFGLYIPYSVIPTLYLLIYTRKKYSSTLGIEPVTSVFATTFQTITLLRNCCQRNEFGSTSSESKDEFKSKKIAFIKRTYLSVEVWSCFRDTKLPYHI